MVAQTKRPLASVTVQQAAALLGLSKNSAYEAAHRGEIPALRFNGRLVVPLGAIATMLGSRPTRCSNA